MIDPQDLPGRFGRVVKAFDRVLEVTKTQAVVAGGWAVWRHGVAARVTQDLAIVVAAAPIDELLRIAALSGFDVIESARGGWPRVVHKETGIRVDLLPEGGRPGTATRPAPTTIRHPAAMGAEGPALRYASIEALVELKIAAGRPQDEADVVQLIRSNDARVAASMRSHLATIHPDYVAAFDRLAARAADEREGR